jgi:hypothetical protein
MDVTYLGTTSGGSLFDAMGGFAGGALVEATADTITTATFELDGNIEGVLVDTAVDGDDLHNDLRVTGIGPTIVKNVLHPSLGTTGNAFGIDFFTDTGFKVRLNVDDVTLFLTNNVFFFTGEAEIWDQMLPFGIPRISDAHPVLFSYTATMPAVNGALAAVGMAGGSGVFTISAVTVPEPAMVGLACLACMGLSFFRRRVRANSG